MKKSRCAESWRTRFKYAGTIATLLLVLGLLAWQAYIRTGSDLRNIQFHLIDGRTIRLSDSPHDLNLLVFWATTCGVCLEEQSELAELYRRFKGLGLRLVSVAMPYDQPNRVLQYARERQLDYPVALDLRGEIVQSFHVRGTPTSVLIASNGVIERTIIGKTDFGELRWMIADRLQSNKQQ